MIKIKNATILDILPHTFKTNECKALSKAISALTVLFYEKLSSVIFWADIPHATEQMLDVMASELDAPFYMDSMTAEQKRAIVSATFEYNAEIGTAGSVSGLLQAAFNNGIVHEWFKYGGEPYHFKAEIKSDTLGTLSKSGRELFAANINKVKPKRAKLDDLKAEIQKNIHQPVGTVLQCGETAEFTVLK